MRIHTQRIRAKVSDTESDHLEMYYSQILNSRMTEAPQPSVTGLKMVTGTEKVLKAAAEKTEKSVSPVLHGTSV